MTPDTDPTETATNQLGFDFDPSKQEGERSELEVQEARFFIARMRESLQRAGQQPHEMRAPCPSCGCTLGVLVVKSGQNTVRCGHCQRNCYNAPKTETGQVARTVKTLRSTVKPSQQARILDRDHGRCILCGTPGDLTIGHLLSIADGARLGALESELNDDANLAAMCEGCNAGLGSRSVSTRTYLIIMLRILQTEVARTGPRR